MRRRYFLPLLLGTLALAHCQSAATITTTGTEIPDPAEVAVGERLFLETRFAQFFAANAGNDLNSPLAAGDPVMDLTLNLGGNLPGPFAGQSMNCRACHMVDEFVETPGAGMRSYNDFTERSPIPDRGDGRNFTPRNSPPLVNSTLFRNGDFFLHFDGEFGSIEDLVTGTLTGRNFGWLPTEHDEAIANLASVIRADDGSGPIAQDFAVLPYKVLLKGTDSKIPEELRLPEAYRIDVESATDDQILAAVSKLIGAYVNNLIFLQDANGLFNGSPYDLFLQKNNLPRQPDQGETPLDYSRRLIAAVNALQNPVFVTPSDGSFAFHDQEFRFGEAELAGLKIFFQEPPQLPLTQEQRNAGAFGNCVACHMAPAFTDFGFHNTGVTQKEYDGVHGLGKFQNLFIPSFAERSADPTLYLPPTGAHPNQLGSFASVPAAGDPQRTDLGMWVVLGNPDIPNVQATMLETLCGLESATGPDCNLDTMLDRAVARFKTPGLRDLSHSSPYMHSGKFPELEDVAAQYREFSDNAKNSVMRNPPKEFEGMALQDQDFLPLVSFLKSLNEDYE